jgi:hypothetical protein
LALLLFSQHKMIDWLTKVISKYESVNNNNKVNESEEEQLTRENKSHYIRKNEEFIISIMIISEICTKFYEFSNG